MDRAPIAIFCFRRPKHLALTLEALEACNGFEKSPIYIFSDGPRNTSDEIAVRQVRNLLADKSYKNAKILLRERNFGLANSIIEAVTNLTNEFGRCIVVEDDLIFQPSALDWLNGGLNKYADQQRVMQVSAYQYRVPEFAASHVGSFQRFATTWGWATWQRAWAKFDPIAEGWEKIRDDPAQRKAFDAGGVYPFSAMLEKQIAGKVDSWGIRWSWAVFRNSGLTVMPPRSLVTNTGMDASGTHNSIGALKKFVSGPTPLLWRNASPPQLPDDITLSQQEERAFRAGLRRTNAMRNARIKAVLARLGMSRFAS